MKKLVAVFVLLLSSSVHANIGLGPVWVNWMGNFVDVYGLNLNVASGHIWDLRCDGTSVWGVDVDFLRMATFFILPGGTVKDVYGVHLSPGFSTAHRVVGLGAGVLHGAEEVYGVQAGLVTGADTAFGVGAGFCVLEKELNGVAVGVITKTKIARGFQIGLINTCEERLTGIQVGALNFAQKPVNGGFCLQVGLYNQISGSCVPVMPVANLSF